MRKGVSVPLRLSSLWISCLVVAITLISTASGCGGGGGSKSGTSGTGGDTTPTPTIASISPGSASAGSAALTLAVSGSGFVSSSLVQVGGISESTTYVSAGQLTAIVPATQIVSGANLTVVVSNGSKSSAAVNLEIDNPVPTITSVSPASETMGTTSLSITVTGTGFVPATVINVNGAARTATITSATQATVTLTSADVASSGSLSLTAVNAKPGGGTSSASAVSVVAPNPVPTISSLNPASVTAGSTAPIVTVTGTGFVASTVINVSGNARATSFISATQVSVTLNAADVSTAGTLSLAAVNPSPGGGASSGVSLPINNPTVGVIHLSPNSLTSGAASPATVTVTGSTFVASSVVQVNGAARATTYVNASTLSFVATVADQASQAVLAVTVTNPAPGGGTSPVANLTIALLTPTPVITSVTPNPLIAGSSDTFISVAGTGFTSNSVVLWNGSPLISGISYYPASSIYATVPAADLTTAGTASVTVKTPTANPSLSNALTVNITNPPAPTLTSLYPSGGPINTAATVSLTGTGFTTATTVAVNGEVVSSTFSSSNQITCTIPAVSLALPGNVNITVTTPAPGGGTSAPLAFTTFISIPNNDIVYNATDGLLYASVPATGIGTGGNSLVGIDPVTGNIKRQIWVGTKPNKLALSTDGKQMFVGIDGAGAVAQVDLPSGSVVNQFSLGGAAGIYNPPYTAGFLAAVPGSPNSVAVSAGTGITIYDSGVPRPNSSTGVGFGPIAFGSSSSILYLMNGATIEQLTVDSTGISAGATLATATNAYYQTSVQYDNGRLYLSNGQVFDASTGTLLGTFYSTATSPATGPVVSDSTLGRAFIGLTGYSANGQVLAFDETTFNAAGNISVNAVGSQGYPTTFQKIVRWGQNGLALSAVASSFTTLNQIYILQSPLVKDISASPADLAVTLTAPPTASTGTAISWVAKITNNGPNSASGAALTLALDSSLIINSVTASQGSCGRGAEFTCDLGSLANGASATITVSATPTTSGTFEGSAALSSSSTDPIMTNNQATANTAVSGGLYGAVPLISAISPSLVQSGSSDFTLTVSGTGFNESSTVNLGATALATSFASTTELTATVPAAEIANYGWAAVTVSNPSPGGGVSPILPLTIYMTINIPASGLAFDPYSQKLYATIPSTATTLTGNSIVAIDPVTGTVGTPVLVGSQPTVMAEASDGNYMYIGLTGSNSVAQFDLLHQNLKATIPLAITQYSTTTPVTATWLAAMPGSDATLAINVSNGWSNFGIFDISGNTGSFRPNFSGIYAGVNPSFGDASHVYAFDSQTSGAEFYRYIVDANGLTEIDGTTLNGMGGYSGSVQVANGRIYGAAGGIANPFTTPPSQIATLPLLDFYGSGSVAAGIVAVPDPSLKKDFLLMENLAGTSAYALVRYDLGTYLPETLLNIPNNLYATMNGWSTLRWGQDGFALLSSSQNYSNNQTTTAVLLLRGPFVTPQLLATNAAATLTSSSTSTFTHGSGNTMLTLTGSNFLPGVAVTWNGSYRTTTIVDATHVTVAIPASDLAATGTASLVATNPGASASSTLTLTIN